MPPQQFDRLLDLIDDILDFRAHDDTFTFGEQTAIRRAAPIAI
jgi:hypothetical protein